MAPINLNLGNRWRTRDGIHAPVALPPKKSDGNQWKGDCVWTFWGTYHFSPTGFEPRTIQSVAIRHTYFAVPSPVCEP